MADPVSFAVGTAIAVVGLLASFDGAVQGYKTLTDMFAKDTRLEYMALQYEVEALKFKLWGAHCRISAKDSWLLNAQPEIQYECRRLIQEISRQQEVAGKQFLVKYDLIEPHHSDNVHNWVVLARDIKKPRNFWRRWTWILSHRGEFADLLTQLTKMNSDLWDLIRTVDSGVNRITEADLDHITASVIAGVELLYEKLDPQEVIGNQIAGHVVTSIQHFWAENKPAGMDRGQLARDNVRLLTERQLELHHPKLDEPTTPSVLANFLAIMAEIQKEDMSSVAKRVDFVDRSALDLYDDGNTGDNSTAARNARVFGRHKTKGQSPEPVIVEWKVIDPHNADKIDIIMRVKALGTLLCSTSASPAFCRHICLGLCNDPYFQERTGEQRFGFVYRLPAKSSSVPRSLLDMLKDAQHNDNKPPLGVRFQLAYKLASAMALFHVSGWIHKSFRSDNILFGPDEDIARPYISGFQYSRHDGDASLEARPTSDPELNLYYHPDVLNGWTRLKDIYSLGIVLLEVASWEPVCTWYQTMPRKTGRERRAVSKALIGDLNGWRGKIIEGLVGTVFVGVIRCCLEGATAFHVPPDDPKTEVESRMLNDAFFEKVVSQLYDCKA